MQTAANYIDQLWDDSIIPTLMEYISIPNKSPQFDPDWKQNGHMDKAMHLLLNWCQKHALPNMEMEIIEHEGKTPVLFLDIPGDNDETILLYGHMDKQPEMVGWAPGLSPWQPVIEGEKLYGRGGADDGYALFASLTAIKVLHENKIPHARCVILIEASEESGSPDLPFYIEKLKDRIGAPNLVICLDSGCGNYNQLWITTSLRGLMSGNLKIKVTTAGIHSGIGSGVVPSPMRILRQLLNRIEEESSGNILIKDLHVEIPTERIEQADKAAAILGSAFYDDLPFADQVEPEAKATSDLILRQTWHPALSVIGLDGLPNIKDAGNVTIPELNVKLSMRLPPTADAKEAAQTLKNVLEKDPPYQADITFTIHEAGTGWNAPKEAAWLIEAADLASREQFGHPATYMGEGGSIPFMGMLGKRFPQAQFLITGVLGPESNAHGPNEFLHIPTAKKLTACIAQVIQSHYLEKNTTTTSEQETKAQ